MRWDGASALIQSRTAWLQPSCGDGEAESVFLVLPAPCGLPTSAGPGLACTPDSARAGPGMLFPCRAP